MFNFIAFIMCTVAAILNFVDGSLTWAIINSILAIANFICSIKLIKEILDTKIFKKDIPAEQLAEERDLHIKGE